MALIAQSLILYGFEITDSNKYIDFKISGGGSELTGTLTLGYYSLSGLMTEVKRAMEAADTANTYTVSADRTISSGTQNRVTISTTGAFLSILFLTGTHNAATFDTLLGFTHTDKTGALTYTGASTAGTAVIPTKIGYTYLGPDNSRKVFGSVNVSASGVKEAVVFQVQQFIEVNYKYESTARITSVWAPFFQWSIEQKPFDFTPEVTSPSVFYDVTLEKTSADGSGLAYKMSEMLPEFPFNFSTGLLTMRKRVS
jgi:hypothetical protein